MAKAKEQNILQYKGKPLVRSGNTLYYGDPTEKCIAMLTVLTSKDDNGVALSERVVVQIMSTDESLHPSRRILKKTEKVGLYSALSIASIWLTRALA